MAKRYIVDLAKDEKEQLIELVSKGRPGARKIKRANMLVHGEPKGCGAGNPIPFVCTRLVCLPIRFLSLRVLLSVRYLLQFF